MLALVVSVAIVSVLWRWANQLGLMQHVNHRSSHVRPTPTGGGLGIAFGTVIGGVLVCIHDGALLIVLLLAGLVAAFGLADDRWPLPARLRLLLQFAVMIVLVWLTGGAFLLASGDVSFGVLVAGAALVLAGVWWLNLYNFLDGIDGYAGSEALLMIIGALGLAFMQGAVLPGTSLFALMLVATVAIVGFLGFNWPPAKIFMGDVGSTFLGFLLFAFALLSASAGWISLWQWTILGVLFAADATTALLRRLVQGENVMEAHRSHAYQRLSQHFGGHRPVVLGLVATNVVIIWPLAFIAGQATTFAIFVAICTYLVAMIAAFVLGSGQKE